MSAAIDRWGSPAWAFQTAADAQLDLFATQLAITTPVQLTQSGTGYSFNLVSVTSSTAAGNTRGWRVNVTTSASITHGDLQCVHGYLTLGSGVTLTAGAAVYPLSAWIDVPADLTTGTGNVIAGLRVIFDANGVDWSTLAGGGESALIYAQTWAAASSVIDHGLRIVAGAGTTIGGALSIGGSGTFTSILELTEWGANTLMKLFTGGVKDAQSRHTMWYMGDSATSAAVFAEVSVVAALGSLYFSTAGIVFCRTGNAGASTDWISLATNAAV